MDTTQVILLVGAYILGACITAFVMLCKGKIRGMVDILMIVSWPLTAMLAVCSLAFIDGN